MNDTNAEKSPLELFFDQRNAHFDKVFFSFGLKENSSDTSIPSVSEKVQGLVLGNPTEAAAFVAHLKLISSKQLQKLRETQYAGIIIGFLQSAALLSKTHPEAVTEFEEELPASMAVLLMNGPRSCIPLAQKSLLTLALAAYAKSSRGGEKTGEGRSGQIRAIYEGLYTISNRSGYITDFGREFASELAHKVVEVRSPYGLIEIMRRVS